MFIFEGKSEKPVYLHVENLKAQLLSADELWGKSVWETDEILHNVHQDPLAKIACVGRSAEQGCLYSGVINDLHRAAGRSGVGTVMASKQLKAVVVRGNLGVGNIDNPKAFCPLQPRLKSAGGKCRYCRGTAPNGHTSFDECD